MSYVAARRLALRLLSRQKPQACSRRFASRVVEKNIVTSVYSDIALPNCSVNDYFWQNLDRWPDKTAVVCGLSGRGLTFSQMYRISTSFAASLRLKLKLETEDTVAIVLPNCPEYPCVFFGVLRAGCVVTTVNPMYTAEEIKKQLELVNCKAVVTSKMFYPAVSEALKGFKSPIPVMLTDYDSLPEGTIRFAEFAEDFSINTDCLKSVDRNETDVAVIPFSSGTTGLPKGVVLTHGNIIASNQQIIDDEILAIQPTTENHQDVFPAVLPFFHIFGMVVVMMNQLLLGCKLVTLPNFNPEMFLKTMVNHKVTAMFCVPPIVVFLGKHPMVTSEHLKSLKSIICGAAPLSEADTLLLLKKSPKTIIRQGYGLTETSSVSTIGKKDEMNYASVGFPVAKCDVKVADPNSGEALGPNEDGEIWVRGPHVMKGYFNNDKANSEVFEDGWFKTGDIGHYDEKKYVYITDRLKELIKVKGFQVPPAELEALIRTHPKVSDCAVIGIPDAISGEVPKAFLVLQPGQKLEEEEIKEFVNSKVAAYKKINSVQFIDAIPKNPAGKILRKDIKKNYC